MTALAGFVFHAGQVTPNDLKSFDYYRFGTTEFATDDSTAFDTQLSAIPPADTFSLGPNGVVSRDGEPKRYYLSYNRQLPKFTVASEPSTATNIAQKYNLKGNIFSSITCAVSPLTSAEIENLIVTTANRYGVDPRLAVAVGWNESRFDRMRNSPEGARGPMQLMPETARRIGVSDICDPVSNIDGGVRYLRLLLDEFENPLLAVAAYDAGEQAIYDHNGVPPFPETVGYVANVLNYQLGLGPPADGKAVLNRRPNQTPEATPESAGVFGVASRLKFVGGVMQF